MGYNADMPSSETIPRTINPGNGTEIALRNYEDTILKIAIL